MAGAARAARAMAGAGDRGGSAHGFALMSPLWAVTPRDARDKAGARTLTHAHMHAQTDTHTHMHTEELARL